MKTMTKEELMKENPWLEVAEMYNPKDKECLFSKKNCYVCKKDKAVIDKYNENLEKTANGKDAATKEEILKDKIIPYIPAEPWWGNPLNARLIVLSLNPGYVPEVNEKLAKLLQSNDIIREQLINFKAKTLRLEANSFLPIHDESGFPISCKDAVNMLGDWYWYKMLKRLRTDIGIDEDDFFKKIALVEYHGYSSETSNRMFPLHKKHLKSQEFTRDVIHYIAQRDNVRFLIMRSIDKWKELLNSNNPHFFEDCQKEGKILCKTNKGMSQAISPNNLGKIYEDIKILLSK
jgi:hypothetical protein